MKLFRFTAVLLLVPVVIGSAQAQQDVIIAATISWVSFHVEGNMGGGWDTECDNWEPGTTALGPSPAPTNAFYPRSYLNDGTFISGAQIGYHFQYAQSTQGFGLDYQAYGGKYRNRTYAYTGASPVGFFIPDPAKGSAGYTCFPYLRWGGVFTSGSHHFSRRFGDITATATRSVGKNYDSGEFATRDRCLFGAECTFMNIGKPDNIELHNNVAANISGSRQP